MFPYSKDPREGCTVNFTLYYLSCILPNEGEIIVQGTQRHNRYFAGRPEILALR